MDLGQWAVPLDPRTGYPLAGLWPRDSGRFGQIDSGSGERPNEVRHRRSLLRTVPRPEGPRNWSDLNVAVPNRAGRPNSRKVGLQAESSFGAQGPRGSPIQRSRQKFIRHFAALAGAPPSSAKGVAISAIHILRSRLTVARASQRGAQRASSLKTRRNRMALPHIPTALTSHSRNAVASSPAYIISWCGMEPATNEGPRRLARGEASGARVPCYCFTMLLLSTSMKSLLSTQFSRRNDRSTSSISVSERFLNRRAKGVCRSPAAYPART